MFKIGPLRPGLDFREINKLVLTERFKIESGGMSIIYKHPAGGGRWCAVKISLRNDSYGEYFIRHEAAALERLSNHPNIVNYYGSGEEGGKKFLIMELLDGKDLQEQAASREKGGRLTLFESLYIAEKAAMALAYIHSRGWVHADIKPENIIWNNSIVKLVDFAFARPKGELLPVEGRTVLGTSGFLSVRRLRGALPEPEDDIVALGFVLYEMIAGERAISQDTTLAEYETFSGRVVKKIKNANLRELIFRMTNLYPEGAKKPPSKFLSCFEVADFIRRMPQTL